MITFNISKRLAQPAPSSERARRLCEAFGLTSHAACRAQRLHSCRLRTEPGDVVLIVGASGVGKSILLREMLSGVPAAEAVDIAEVSVPPEGVVFDALPGGFIETLQVLSTAGLNDLYTLLQSPADLSAGELYRFRLALALALRPALLFADDFGQGLDPITASVVASNLHRFAKRWGTTIILASNRLDFARDLEPDILVETDFTSPARAVYKDRRRQ